MPTLLLALAATAWLVGCDAALDPFEESGRYFSIFGYLNASEDTQYVRITSLRDSIATAPGPLDAAVVLEHLGSGERTIWKDSLFRFDDGRYAHNFWSVQRLEPGETYRLTATRSDGAASGVTVTMPERIAHPFLDTGASIGVLNPSLQAVSVEGVVQLADVQFRYRVLRSQDPGAPVERLSLTYLKEVQRYNNGRLAFNANLYQDLRDRTGGGCPIVLESELFLVAAGPGWPDFLAFDPETLALPDVVANVEHGVGFVGGVTTRVVPWTFLTGLFQNKKAWCEQGCLSLPRGC